MARRLSEAQWLTIKTKYELGESIRGVAREFDIPDSTIHARIKKEKWTKKLSAHITVIQDEIHQIEQSVERAQLPIIQAKLNEAVDLMGMFKSFVDLAANLNVQVLRELSTEPDLKTRIIGLNSLKATFKDIADITKAPPVSSNPEDAGIDTVKIEFVNANK